MKRPLVLQLLATRAMMMTTTTTLPSCMKCIVYGKDGQLEWQENRPIPKTANDPHDVILVKVHAVGLNPVDAKFVIGDKLPSWLNNSALQRWYLSNKIPGFDFCGTVVSSSTPRSSQPDEIDSLHPGDQVFGTMPPFHGTLAEYIAVPINQVSKKPMCLSCPQAAALPLVGLTALQAMSGLVQNGSNVLILGVSGGTGHVAAQVAVCLGAKQIVGVCSASHFEFAALATDVLHLVDYHKDDWLQELIQHGPYDFVLDCVTSADSRDQAFNYPRRLQSTPGLLVENYRYRRLGGPTRDWFRASLRRVAGLDMFVAKEDLFWVRFPNSKGELEQLCRWAEEGKLRPLVTDVRSFSVANVRDAFERLRSRRVEGKIVIDLNEKSGQK